LLALHPAETSCQISPMTLPAPTYDLVLLLDPDAEQAARAKIVADARAAIEAQGELLRHDDWGSRALAYQIDRSAAAEYHLLQFHATTAELLSGLNRSLGITDGVLRFRIIKLKPGVPDPPDMKAVAVAGSASAASAARRAEPQDAGTPDAGSGPETSAAQEAVSEPAVEETA